MIIDSSVLIDLQRRNKKTTEQLDDLRKRKHKEGYIPFMGYFEFLYGVRNKEEKGKSFLDEFHFLRPTARTADIMIDLRIKYEGKGALFSLADLMIASQAIEHGMTLVTKDAAFLKMKEVDVVLIS